MKNIKTPIKNIRKIMLNQDGQIKKVGVVMIIVFYGLVWIYSKIKIFF
jgi:hypothetical protein